MTGLLAETVGEIAPAWYRIGQRDYAILIPFGLFMLGVAVITFFSHRYQKTGDFRTEYFVAGRSFGAWVLAMSWVATLASGGSFLGYPSLVYSYGWTMAFWVSGSIVTAVVGLGIVGKRINRLARRTGALTLVDLLRDRFGSNAVGVTYSAVILVTTSVYLVAQFVAGARILESLLETSYTMGLLLFAVSVVAYTTFGGFRAVAWTDTLQGIVMIVGVVLLVPVTLSAVGSLERATLTGEHSQAVRVDPEAAEHGVETDRHAYLYPPGPRKQTEPGDEEMGGVFLPLGMGLSLFLIRSLGAVMMPTTVPRMLAFRDTRALRRALIVLAPYFLLMYGSSLITMNCAPALGVELPPGKSDQAMPALVQRLVELDAAPALLAGLLIAAPFAAVMSTVDSALLVISACVVRDLIEKSFAVRLTDTVVRRLSYTVTALAGAGVFVGALMIEPRFLQPLVIHYVGGAASALFWPALATLFWRRATATGVTAGLAGGGLIYIAAIFFKPLVDPVVSLHPFVFGFFGSLLLVTVVSRLTAAQDDEQLAPYFGRG
jgi:sodium/pantothenate symporter